MISSHWSSSEQAVSAIKKHEVSYNFTCYPEEAYSITYPASGDFELSGSNFNLIIKNGVFLLN